MKPTKYYPQEINIEDDAYHETKKFFSEEWWYFDAIFDNNYSLHTDFTIFSKKNKIASSAIEIYKDGKLEAQTIKRHLFKPFEVSSKYPSATITGQKIMYFDIQKYNNTGEWVYNFNQELDDCALNLIFKGTTKGWKIVTDDLSWTVALPKAIVNGDITLNGETIKVRGVGYHDHNWNGTLSTIFKLIGWYWGKITSNSMNVTWGNLIKNRTEEDIFAVINKDGMDYFPINPQNINFKREKFIRQYGRKVSTEFSLKINDNVNDIPISVDVKMKIKNSHFKSLKIALCYWRYHIQTEGFISIGSNKEPVNDTHIMEFFRFA
jgi:predicted secreted hydrolase